MVDPRQDSQNRDHHAANQLINLFLEIGPDFVEREGRAAAPLTTEPLSDDKAESKRSRTGETRE